MNNLTEVTHFLLQNAEKHQIDLNMQGEGRNTPLHLACKNKLSETALYLVQNAEKHQIDLNMKDEYGKTPLYLACKNQLSETALYLVQNAEKHKIDLNMRDEYGNMDSGIQRVIRRLQTAGWTDQSETFRVGGGSLGGQNLLFSTESKIGPTVCFTNIE